jgi:uroporphyrinogen-III synthase
VFVTQSLTGLQVISFETRLQSEAAGLIEKYGGRVIAAPALKEVPLTEVPEVKAFLDALFGDAIDVLILLTGVGTTLLVRAALKQRARAQVLAQLAKVTLVCRGPKPSAALKPFGLRPTLTVPEPNTWRDLIAMLDAEFSVDGRRVYIQEYGTRNERLVRALSERGAHLTCLKLYDWALPDDTGPLKAAILKIVRGQAHIALFTTGLQIDHLLLAAREIGLTQAVRRALNHDLVVASVGPMTSEALERHGITPDIVPGHPKLGHLVLAVARRGPALLGEKRERSEQLIVNPVLMPRPRTA